MPPQTGHNSVVDTTTLHRAGQTFASDRQRQVAAPVASPEALSAASQRQLIAKLFPQRKSRRRLAMAAAVVKRDVYPGAGRPDELLTAPSQQQPTATSDDDDQPITVSDWPDGVNSNSSPAISTDARNVDDDADGFTPAGGGGESSSSSSINFARRPVTILGLFELSTDGGRTVRPEGRSELAAARLAVRHINEQNVLLGYRLQLVTNDTQVCWQIIHAFAAINQLAEIGRVRVIGLGS